MTEEKHFAKINPRGRRTRKDVQKKEEIGKGGSINPQKEKKEGRRFMADFQRNRRGTVFFNYRGRRKLERKV